MDDVDEDLAVHIAMAALAGKHIKEIKRLRGALHAAHNDQGFKCECEDCARHEAATNPLEKDND